MHSENRSASGSLHVVFPAELDGGAPAARLNPLARRVGSAEVTDGKRAEPDGAASPARARAQATPRVGQADVRGSRRAAGVLGVQDQPGRDRPGLGLPARRPRHAARSTACPRTQRESLVQLARDSRQKGWWHAYSDTIQPHFATYLGLESAASEIRIYEVSLIPEPAADRGLRPGRDQRGHGEQPGRGRRAPGRAADGPPARPDPGRPAEGLGGAGRGGAAPPGGRRRAHAAAAGVPAGAGHAAERRRCR